MLSRHRSREICSIKGSSFKMNKMDPSMTWGQDCHSGYLPGSSAFMFCSAWGWALSPPWAEPGVVVGDLPYWCQWLCRRVVSGWETNLMCISGVSGEPFLNLMKDPSLRERGRQITDFKGSCGSPQTAWFFGNCKESECCVCMHVECLCVCVRVNTQVFDL